MDKVEFIRQFAALCLARAQKPEDGMVEVWWETVNDRPFCLSGIEWGFKQLRTKGEKFMPSVGELIDLAEHEVRRTMQEGRQKFILEEPKITDDERAEAIIVFQEARELLTRKMSMSSAELRPYQIKRASFKKLWGTRGTK